jgi:PAS domain S-box-containing protein
MSGDDLKSPTPAAILEAAGGTIMMGLAAVDDDGRQTYVNPAFCRMVGYTRDELIGARAPYAYWPAEELEAIQHAFTLTLEGRAPAEGFELSFARKNGQRFWVQLAIAPMFECGERIGWLASLFEIEERKQLAEERAERKRQEEARDAADAERRRLTEILDHMPAGVMIADATGATMYANRRAQQIFGEPIPSPAAPDLYSATFSAWHPDGRALASSEFPLVRALRGEVVDGQEVRFRRATGDLAIVRAYAAPICDLAGAVVAAVTSYYDITAQVLLQETIDAERAANLVMLKASEARFRDAAIAIAESEQRFRTLAEATSTIVWQTDATGRAREPSASWLAFTGQRKETWTPGTCLEAIHPDDLERVVAAWSQAITKRSTFKIDCRVRRHDGHFVPMVVCATPVIGPDGAVKEWIGTHTDITERLALLESEQLARQEAERARQRMALLDRITTSLVGDLGGSGSAVDRLVRSVVPELADWCTVYVPREDGKIGAIAVGHVDPALAEAALEMQRRHPVEPDQPWGISAVLRTGRSENIADITDAMLIATAQDSEHLEAMRAYRMVSHLAVPLIVHGNVIGCLGLTNTTSGRRFSAEDLALAEEVAVRAALEIERVRLYQEMRGARAEAEAANRAKDVFLAMLGHELRNPLAPILTALELMRLRDDGASLKERSVIERQVNHLVRLVDDLLDVSRITRGKIELARQPIEIAEIIAKAIEMSSTLLEQQRHQLSVDVSPTGLRVDGDHARLAQVFCNLITNAAKYTRPGGHVLVAAQRDADEIVVRIKDDGEGIDPMLLPHIFDLFEQGDRTIDRARGGLGIGLTIVKTLVELHGGRVKARSEGLGTGSEFEVRLPASRRAGPQDAASPARLNPSIASHRAVRVLLVDDNQDAVMMLAEALNTLGYETRVAHDGPSGIAAADEFQPAVAMLDIGLPVMDGYELARRLRERVAGIQLIAMTGYGQETDRCRSREAGFVHHLVKPFNLAQVAAILDHIKLRG